MVLNCGSSVAVLERDVAGNHTYDLTQTLAVADPVDVAIRGDWLAVGDTQLYGGSVRTFRRNISAPGRPFVQVQHFNEAYNDAYAEFGSSVILAADQMVVGARGYGANKYGNAMGAVYLYVTGLFLERIKVTELSEAKEIGRGQAEGRLPSWSVRQWLLVTASDGALRSILVPNQPSRSNFISI